MNAYKKLFLLMDGRERRRALLVLAIMFCVALAQVVGVASILPFISVISNPNVVHSSSRLGWLYDALGMHSQHAFVLTLGIAVFVLLVGSLVMQAVGIWTQLRFCQGRYDAWSSRLVAAYLRQPYEWFLSRHSADLSTSVIVEVNQVINGALFPAIQVVTQSLVGLLLLVFLVWVDPVLAVAITFGLGIVYGVIFLLARDPLRRIGRERIEADHERILLMQEAFGGIKEVKVTGSEEIYFRRYRGPSRILADRVVMLGLISQLPSLGIQAVFFGGMLLALIYLIASYGGFQQAAPIAATYAFGGYRLIPALQTVYQQLSQLRFSDDPLDRLASHFRTAISSTASSWHRPEGRISPETAIALREVSYSYPASSGSALQNVSLYVPVRSSVALVGSTGSGKTTTADILLGLLRPSSGSLLVDDQAIADDKLRRWQSAIGYVPQSVFLVDDTIEANIAFGVPQNAIARSAVEAAARTADIHDFIVTQLPAGYDTRVGERGVRLSGGQRQRIAIARALYRDPDVLILDEATSALDNLTEQTIIEAIRSLNKTKTIVIVAHRLSTVRYCDCLFFFEHGRIAASGTYDELVERHPEFRAMAGLM